MLDLRRAGPPQPEPGPRAHPSRAGGHCSSSTRGRGALVLRDPDSGRYFTWDITRTARKVRVGLRITEDDPCPLPFAGDTEGFLANDLRPGRPDARSATTCAPAR